MLDAPLLTDLRRGMEGDRVLAGDLDRVAFANDASMYHLVPRVVVLPKDETEVAHVLAVARRHRVPVTFRAAGTSLSGQGVTDGILVEVARHWRGATVEANGARIRARPGMIGDHLNRILAPHGTRLGPDPSSLAACTLGGILANNSSGPCSGVEQNSYRTLEALKLLLADGTAVDTAEGDAAFLAKAPTIHAGLLALRQELVAAAALRSRVERKYRTKNTTGYGLNALLDFERPVDILAHLLIGSEGTLGFISEAVLRTVPLLPHTSTAFLRFPSLGAACDAIAPFREAGAQMVELLDEASLRAVAGMPGLPEGLDRAGPGAAALLIQAQASSAEELGDREGEAVAAAARLAPLGDRSFTRDATRQSQLIHARKGLYPAVGGARVAGTTLLLEDVALPVERLAAGVADLQGLFRRHRYDDAVIFGHAKDGNLHFLVTQSVADQGEVDRYARFMDDVVELVVGKHDGALKAEHGTGRNMAPFVEREWGTEGVALMRRLKDLLDPAGILNPGVILPAAPRSHLDHLKTVPPVAAEVDACVECGYCESVCPSRSLTLTPRQRIVVQRERTRRLLAGDAKGLASLDHDWRYAGLATCATDGMCGTVCPVGIDTGEFVRARRREGHGAGANAVAGLGAAHYATFTAMGRAALRLGRLLGRGLPKPGRPAAVARSPQNAVAVYFPSCTGRLLLGPGDPFLTLAARAGAAIRVPARLEESCCGLPFASKGFPAAAARVREVTRTLLRAETEGGRLPVIVDGSSCAHAMADLEGFTIESTIAFTRRRILPRLTVAAPLPDAALHLTCGAHHLGLGEDLRALAQRVAARVTVPASNGCCGFAGDRGFRHPELTASATAPMAEEIAAARHTLGLTSNLTCGIGMSRATQLPFRDILEVLEEVTR